MVVDIRVGSPGITALPHYVELSLDLLQWLAERHISYRHYSIREIVGEGNRMRRDAVGFRFEFQDVSSAVLFKLTWA